MAQTGETATLSLPGEHEAITVDFVPSPSSVVSMARVGRPSVPHATAAGKVMLAFTGTAAGTGLTAFTERTITDPAALAGELEAVRDRGWAEAVGEREPDLAALAAPVFGRGDELAAILGHPGAGVPAPGRGPARAPGPAAGRGRRAQRGARGVVDALLRLPAQHPNPAAAVRHQCPRHRHRP